MPKYKPRFEKKKVQDILNKSQKQTKNKVENIVKEVKDKVDDKLKDVVKKVTGKDKVDDKIKDVVEKEVPILSGVPTPKNLPQGGSFKSVYGKFKEKLSKIVDNNLVKRLISNRHDLYVLLSHLSQSSYSSLILQFLKEVIKQMLGNKPSKFFPNLHLPQIGKDNPLHNALSDLLNAKSIGQIMNVILDEPDEEGGSVYHAMRHVLHHSIHGINHHVQKAHEGGSLTENAKSVAKYAVPIISGLGSLAALYYGYNPSYTSEFYPLDAAIKYKLD